MRKNIKITIGIILLSLVIFLGYSIVNKLKQKKTVATRIQQIPSFSFFTLTGKEFTNAQLPKKTIVFVYFNSDCDYCQSEAAKIEEHLNDFNNTQWVFVSFENAIKIENFSKTYKLNNRENVLFLEDKKAIFATIFNANTFPFIVVYDSDRKLLKQFKGATSKKVLLEIIPK
ncbi:TlpA family protein disulfide reductase [Polaribacter sp.]|uniref:TlpA family protein disulfide reductase n=1 Tax=Polaribacter sp. TaxID=1920175 RepID=UPI004047298A